MTPTVESVLAEIEARQKRAVESDKGEHRAYTIAIDVPRLVAAIKELLAYTNEEMSGDYGATPKECLISILTAAPVEGA